MNTFRLVKIVFLLTIFVSCVALFSVSLIYLFNSENIIATLCSIPSGIVITNFAMNYHSNLLKESGKTVA